MLGWCVGVSWLAMILQVFLQCRPVQDNWKIKPYVGGKFACSRPAGRLSVLTHAQQTAAP